MEEVFVAINTSDDHLKRAHGEDCEHNVLSSIYTYGNSTRRNKKRDMVLFCVNLVNDNLIFPCLRGVVDIRQDLSVPPRAASPLWKNAAYRTSETPKCSDA